MMAQMHDILSTLDPLVSLLLAAVDHGDKAAESQPMTDTPVTGVLLWVVHIGVAGVLGGMFMCLYRLMRGPNLADRVLASDMLSLHVAGLVILLCVFMRTTIFFDAALVVAILGFVSTVAFSQYIHARAEEGVEP
ncbi:MAG: monovalent cation/H+ antiporter complex subunit F [Firmicutes bacterium]|nr:monovalent cation/H+ antiporter complex subunit F [Bacillota bacterium]